jgi:hypothetical protein
MDISTSSTVQPENMYTNINQFFMNPLVFAIGFIVIVLYFLLFNSLGNSNMPSYENKNNHLFIIIIGIILIGLVLINGFQYFFGIDIIASIKNLFSEKHEVDIKVLQNDGQTNVPSIVLKKEVFNIPGNYYGYEDAKTLCKAYDARLATYSEVENAYINGAEWCNYGWSEQQMALFPTQQKTFDNLQQIKGHEHDCGRPGVNGGYIANPNVQFGVNCYGYKPKITSEEEEMMQNVSPYPKTQKDINMEKRVDYWKTKINEILISPFNYNSWSKL